MFGLLTYYDFSISTGPLEGTNKIKTLQKQAYGFRDLLFFKLKILALHERKYRLGIKHFQTAEFNTFSDRP